MPTRAKRMCSCGKDHIGHCYQTPSIQCRGNSTYKDKEWIAFRLWYLSEYPLCSDCLDRHETTIANEIHHIQKLSQHPELKYELSNLKALCKQCHSVRTRRGE